MYVNLCSISQDISRCKTFDNHYHGPSMSEIAVEARKWERARKQREWEEEVMERRLEAMGGIDKVLNIIY